MEEKCAAIEADLRRYLAPRVTALSANITPAHTGKYYLSINVEKIACCTAQNNSSYDINTQSLALFLQYYQTLHCKIQACNSAWLAGINNDSRFKPGM